MKKKKLNYITNEKINILNTLIIIYLPDIMLEKYYWQI